MLKRLMIVVLAVSSLALSGCCALHCEKPCYGRSFQRDGRQMMDFVDVYFLNYDKHDPYRCDPCLGD